MAYKIVWTNKARSSLENVVHYLELHWPEKVLTAFTLKLNQHLNLLSLGILKGSPSSKANVRSVLVTKQNRLYFRIKNKIIQILLLWDTRQNPAKNPFE